jgi:hypothetical protein
MSTIVSQVTTSLKNVSDVANNQAQHQSSFVQNEIPKVFTQLERVLSSIQQQNQSTLGSLQQLLDQNMRINNESHEEAKRSIGESERRLIESSINVSESLNSISHRTTASFTIAAEQAAQSLNEMIIKSSEALAEKSKSTTSALDAQISSLSQEIATVVNNSREVQEAQHTTIQNFHTIIEKISTVNFETNRAQGNITSALNDFKSMGNLVATTSDNLLKLPPLVQSTSGIVNDLLQRQKENLDSLTQSLHAKNQTWDQSTDLFTRKYQTASEQIEKSYGNLVAQFSKATDLSENISELSDNINTLNDVMAKKAL